VLHLGSGELLFDALAPWLTRLPLFRWGIQDARRIERWSPRLHLAGHVPFATHYAWIPVRGYRVLYRVMNSIPGLRSMFQELRFTF
jgi:hypothetical protein